jgi:hypothetical protein
MNVGRDNPFFRRPRRFLARARDPFSPQNRFSLGNVATGFFQSSFAIHHARVRFLAELFDGFGIDIGHNVH